MKKLLVRSFEFAVIIMFFLLLTTNSKLITVSAQTPPSPTLLPCQGKSPGECKFDTRTQFYLNGQYVESVTANGKTWNWNQDQTPWPNNGADYSSLSRYKDGPCSGQSSPCKFDTRSQFKLGADYVESVTYNDHVWNWYVGGNNDGKPWPDVNNPTPALFSQVDRYKDGPCSGQSSPCKFDTRTQMPGTDPDQYIESVTAYGKTWNWTISTKDNSITPWGGADLTAVTRYQNGPCQGKTGSDCKFDTRVIMTVGSVLIESVTAYGKGWNWYVGGSNDGKPWPDPNKPSDFDLTTVQRYTTPPTPLFIRTSKSYLEPGKADEFYLYVWQDKTQAVPYNGQLEFVRVSCGNDCKPVAMSGCTGPIEIVNGIGKSGSCLFPSDDLKAVFRPKDRADYNWSNVVHINYRDTTGIYDAKNLWMIPDAGTPDSSQNIFEGTNFAWPTPQPFQAAVGYTPAQPLTAPVCSPPDDHPDETGHFMYFTKSNKYGYWSPAHPPGFSPWLGNGGSNIVMNLIGWERKPGWHDEYLWNRGYEAYACGLNGETCSNGLGYQNNFPGKETNGGARFITLEQYKNQFPPYVYSPRYIAEGYGIESGQLFDYENMCNDPKSIPSGDSAWKIQADIVQLDYDGYKGPAVRYIQYEGYPQYYNRDYYNSSNNDHEGTWLREDWYFVPSIGLVRLDQKFWGRLNGVRYGFCLDDPDCMINDMMVQPHNRMVLKSFLHPTPAPVPGSEYTVSYRVAESPTGLDNALDQPYDNSPKIFNYTFTNPDPGPKTLYIRFKTNTGKTADNSRVIYYQPAPPPAPTGLSASCPVPGTTANLSWNTVSGATFYSVYAQTNDHPFDWPNACTRPNFCQRVIAPAASISFNPTVPEANYTWFVTAGNSSGESKPASGSFICISTPKTKQPPAPISTPVPTPIPTPTPTPRAYINNPVSNFLNSGLQVIYTIRDAIPFLQPEPTPAPTPALSDNQSKYDLNKDNRIDTNDYSILLSAIQKANKHLTLTAAEKQADFNSDGVINMVDYFLFKQQFKR